MENESSGKKGIDRRIIFIVIFILIIPIIVFVVAHYTKSSHKKPQYERPESAFSGSSSDLKNTTVLLTLDEPIPEEKNAIWCLSFQLAWNELKDYMVKDPKDLKIDDSPAGRLNRSPQSDKDIIPENYYAAAGPVNKETIEKIKNGLEARFPSVTPPDFSDAAEFIAYSYLQVQIEFPVPYFGFKKPLDFYNSNGKKIPVTYFGVPPEQKYPPVELMKQVKILLNINPYDSEKREFAVDLFKDSNPDQIVIAKIKKGKSLGETFAYLETKVKESGGNFEFLCDKDILQVPNISFDISHRNNNIGYPFKEPGNQKDAGYVEDIQRISFCLDKNGVDLKSTATIDATCEPQQYVFDEPFLIYIKKRDAKYPYFIMWIDNADLLCKPDP